MSLVKHNIKNLSISFQTLSAPPPFSHHYQIGIELSAAHPQVDFTIQYSERDQLSEEEILEEGFTLEDDYQWQGALSKNWKFAIIDELRKSKKLFEEPKPHVQQILELDINYENGEQMSGIPNNSETWEYFTQEIIQAIYEVSGKEMPLEIIFMEISPQDKSIIRISPSFSYRKVKVNGTVGGQTNQKEYEWERLKPLLEAIYQPDYETEQASEKEPKKPGSYISPGDGLWYELGKAVMNPGKKKDVVGEMEKSIKKLV